MIDLTAIPNEVRLARGDYATVRAAHEDFKKALSVHCGALAAIAAQVLRQMQPDNDQEPAGVSELIANGRTTLDAIDRSAAAIILLAAQRKELRGKAWPK